MDAHGVSPFSSSIYEKYDVFLSFRGEDTRNNFTSHLYAALKRKQIETYIDERSLERGDDITLALPEAIQRSKISIIIFSKGYASSSWCLRELVHILECRQENKQMVIPVFYEVDPSHIRKQEGSYGEAFLKHQEHFEDKMGIVQKWRAALIESADLSGWDSRVTRPESELVEAIVDDVLRKLNRIMPSSDIGREGLIGIKQHIQEIELMLSLDSPDIRIVGIWGLGGTGKTTLADVVFNTHFYQYEGYCFLANVREESEKLGLVNLRDKLLGELLKEKNMNLGTPSLPPQVKDRLRRKKVLVVLDYVNDSDKFEVLVGDRDLFGHGSRIIVTTRDAKVLKDIEANGTYEVKRLNYDEALQLFKWKAFRGHSLTTDYVKLSNEVVKYAGGIPLAINILASHLRSLYPKSIGNWETMLSCLKEVSKDDIVKKLRISYDGLNEKDRAIFLDIACFFKGESKELVESILNGCGFSASIRINNLVNKSLISIGYGNTLWMHDLVQEMGWKIVQQQSEEQPGQQSRLWMAKDAYRVLKNNEGTRKIEGIFLDMAKIDNDLHLSPDVFRKMSKLRLLKIYNVQGNKVYLRQNLQSLPHTLRYLHWEGYPSKRLPSKFDPQNLVQINMPYNQLEQLSNEVQGFDNLKSIDLRHSIHLIQFPDFSHAPKLEKINLQCSTSFSQVPWHSLQNLDKLTHLNLSHCRKLQTLPMIMTRSLASLDLSSTAIEYLTSSICSLNNLSELNLNECRRLANLPSKINELDSLKYLKLSGCSALQKFPELPRNIIELDIRGTAIKEVTTASIEGRFDLTRIYLSNCRSLETLPTNIFRLRSLAYLDLEGCSKLKKLPKILEPMTSLKKLYLQRTGIRLLPLSIGNLIGLQLLDMDMCEQLESLPSSIANMSRLWKLMLSNCPKLEYFPRFSGSLSSDLEVLYLNNSNVIEIPDSIKGISKLRELYVSNCKNLRSLPELPLALQILDASGCESLKVVLNSRRALKQKFWDDYHVTEGTVESSIFYDCLKLDKKERDNIIIDFQLRVLRMATQFVPLEVQWFSPTVRACCPGNEIPKWFEHQWEGSSINVKLPPQWHDTNFLGFVVCVVGESYSNTQALDLFCEFNYKSDEGDIRKFTWWFTKLDVGYEDFPFASNSSHVYMWYEHQDYHKCLYAKEASFYFSFKEWNEGEDDWIESSESHVNKCGIHMLHRQELEEFNSLKNQHDLLLKESNAIPNQDESSARGTVVSDTDEPNPKRTKY